MVVLDVSVVNVALPSIGRDLHYSATGLQWVVNAYVLTFAGFLLLGGRAADIFGRRRVYLFGMALFVVASLVGGLAQSAAWLTAARAAQGIGGAFLSPATLTIIVTTFTGSRLPGPSGVERRGRGGRGRRLDPGRASWSPSSTGAGCSSSTCPSGWRPWPRRWPTCPSSAGPGPSPNSTWPARSR